jgi:hypothetical protein
MKQKMTVSLSTRRIAVQRSDYCRKEKEIGSGVNFQRTK